MNSLKKAFRICMQNLRKWTSNPRIWVSVFAAVLFVYSYTKGLGQVAQVTGEPVSPWIFPFLMTFRYMKILFMVPVLLIFCDAPFIDANQAFIMLRTRRRVWSVGQILYIYLGAFVYELMLFVATIVTNITHMDWTMKWGRTLGLAATSSILGELRLDTTTVKITSRIIRYFSPMQAMFFSFVLVWLSIVLLGLIIYVCNSITKMKVVGMGVAAAFILFTAVADGNDKLVWISPITWNGLNMIDVGHMTPYPPIQYVLGIYIVSIVILSVIAVVIGKKQQVIVQEEM